MRLRLLFAGLLTAAAPLAAQSAPIARVDSLVAAGQVVAAVTQIDQALAVAPRDFEVLWRASRLRLLQGDIQPEKSKAQDKLYREALALAERAIKANPTAPDGYLRRAAANGKVALFSGVLDAADYVVQARDDAEKVTAMRGVPPLTLASAHYILGRTHLKLTETPRPLRMPLGLGFGNAADALTHLRRATELRPGFVMFQLEYARALLANDRTAEARAVLQQLPSLVNQEPGDEQRKQEAAALLGTVR
ncbi:MAG: tetratricopeptide repeat protein [Gemmatimonas sp.]|jgi:tetratricopeptide (TPR) repeat protein|uniref:tetratricopeptide repeat protein n=1 Tax=Gemmatimonas sp. TaxID=1962908 RepID=UPI00391FBC3A|nr:tetratricopeptide repeat protein [Gemmatimonadota bacterium]